MEAIAAATSRAAELSMIEASSDPTVQRAFFLLAQIPQAAKSPSLSGALRAIGMQVGNRPTLAEIASSMMTAIDSFSAQHGPRTDYGELAQLSAVESLHAMAAREMSDMFDNEPNTVAKALGELAKEKQFGLLARDFFARLTRRHLNFYLHRELSAHVGEGRRFTSMHQHVEFENALELHCREAARIVQDFAGEWYSKHLFEGGIDIQKAGRFVHVAAKKIREELVQRGVSVA
jgi:hypothetical protein